MPVQSCDDYSTETAPIYCHEKIAMLLLLSSHHCLCRKGVAQVLFLKRRAVRLWVWVVTFVSKVNAFPIVHNLIIKKRREKNKNKKLSKKKKKITKHLF
jgi:5-carboxymethyl-2-hydroxymuconate isomerase